MRKTNLRTLWSVGIAYLSPLTLLASTNTPSGNTATPAEQTPDIPALRQAAEQGEAEAQFNMGICYENGIGVAQDAQEVVRASCRERV